MLPIKLGASWSISSEEEAKNRFLRWPPSKISYQKDFIYFELLVTLMLSIKFQDNQPFVSGEEAKNRFSRWPPSWISHRNNFSNICFLQSFMSIGLSVQEKRLKKSF